MLYERFIETLTNEKLKIENYVSEGHAHDYPSYKFAVGRIRGLQEAIEICEYIYKKGNSNE